jgi:drug/metabolite transporter (DMT)-like permease
MVPRQQHLAAWLALAAGIVCIGFSAIFVKLAHVPGPISAFYRVLIAGAVLVPWWLARGQRNLNRPQFVLILLGGAFFAVDIAMWNTSILLIPAATATLLANNSPLWVGLASFLLFREQLSGRYWLGLAVALSGMMALVGYDAIRHLRLDPGNLLAVGASFFYAAYLLTTHRVRAQVDLLTVMTFSTVVSIVALLLINLAMGSTFTGYGRSAWLALAGLGLISQLGGWLAINYALGHLRAAPVSVCLLAQVVVTTLAAMPLLGEYLKMNQVAGGVLVLAGIYLVTQGPRQEPIPIPD